MIDQILQNDSDSIDIEIYKDGILNDADGDVLVTISDSNGVVLYNRQLATKTATGKYQFTLSSNNTAVLGTYSSIWLFTMSNSVMQHTQQFQVVSAVTNSYLLPSEYRVKTSLDVSEKSDTQLTNYIERATFLIESYLGGSVRMTTYEEKKNCIIDYPNFGVHIQLDHAPIDSLTSLSLQYNPGYSTVLDVDNVRVNEKGGYLEYFGLNLTNAMVASVQDVSLETIKPKATIIYTAGYNEMPRQVELATSRLVDQLINIESKQFQQVKSVSIGKYSESYDNLKGQFSLGNIGADEVIELLKEYKHPIVRNRFII